MSHTVRQGLLRVVGTVRLLAAGVSRAAAQEAPASPRAGQPGRPGRSIDSRWRPDAGTAGADPRRSRRVLEKYPPAVGRVLKLDPALMNNPAYLRPYPALRPSSRSTPKSCTTRVTSSSRQHTVQATTTRSRQRQECYGLLAGYRSSSAFLIVIGLVVIWLVKTLVEPRRWNKLSKVQNEVHSKLLDRFTSNEDLLAYMQTPAGRRFLESAPIPAGRRRPVGAPFSDSLVGPGWSRAAADGLGLLYVSSRFIDEAGRRSSSSASDAGARRRLHRLGRRGFRCREGSGCWSAGPARAHRRASTLSIPCAIRQLRRRAARGRGRSTCLRDGRGRLPRLYDRTARALWAYLSRMTGDPISPTICCRNLLPFSARACTTRAKPTGATRSSASPRTSPATVSVARAEASSCAMPDRDRSDVAVAADDHRRAPSGATDLRRAMAPEAARARDALARLRQGLAHRDIAGTLGVKPASVRLLLFRARRKLAGLLRATGAAFRGGRRRERVNASRRRCRSMRSPRGPWPDRDVTTSCARTSTACASARALVDVAGAARRSESRRATARVPPSARRSGGGRRSARVGSRRASRAAGRHSPGRRCVGRRLVALSIAASSGFATWLRATCCVMRRMARRGSVTALLPSTTIGAGNADRRIASPLDAPARVVLAPRRLAPARAARDLFRRRG